MNILGIDQSYASSGIVVLGKGGKVMHAEKFSSPKAMDVFERSKLIANHIVTVAKQWNVRAVGIEGLAFGMRGDATRDLAGLQFVIVNALREAGFKETIVAPNTVKKKATGSGRAKKEELYEALPDSTQKIIEKLGLKKTTGMYDLTDAYWIAMCIKENQ